MNSLINDLQKNIALISTNSPSNSSFKTRDLILKDDTKCIVIYISGISNKEDIEKCIISPLLSKVDCSINTLVSPASYIAKRYLTISDIELSSDINVICESLKGGKSILLIGNENTAIVCNTSTTQFPKISKSKIEETIRGEKIAFGENLNTNISLIQEKLKNKLNSIKTNYIPDTGCLIQFIEKHPFSIFPQSKTTEKPDKVISDILQGKIAILINGCSYAVILPVVFIEFFQGFEDYSNRIITANFDRFIRILALIIILTASPMYLILINYNVELIPLDLIKIIIISRKDIPLPPFLEIFFMELIIEFLREGGLRLPSTIGQTLSIVGGIILGDASIRSGIVSPTTLVVVAITVIATFLIPNYEMSLSIRLLRFYLLILAEILGFFGLVIGLFSILAHLICLESLGIPYFSPFAPMRHKDLKDSAVRYPLKDINRIPVSFIRRKVKNKKK